MVYRHQTGQVSVDFIGLIFVQEPGWQLTDFERPSNLVKSQKLDLANEIEHNNCVLQ
jgi:hypothetical protein